MTTAPPADLAAAVTRLARGLRERGVLVGPGEAVDAVRALPAVDVGDREDVYLALRSVLATRSSDLAIFDELFAALLDDAEPGGGVSEAPAARLIAPPPRRGAPSLEQWLRSGGAAEEEEQPVPRASDRRAVAAADFATFGDRELGEIARVARRLARRLAMRPSRRWRPSPRGRRPHLRRAIRLSLATGGEVTKLAFRARKRRKVKLVALCDVSGSMDLYARFLLQFLYALQRAFSRVETFAFSTHLARISDELRAGSYREALARLAGAPGGWSGGTRIGESLAEFLTTWPRLVDRRTVVIILSDGWDTGDPAVLADAVRALRRRAGRVVWLNPLLGNPGYRPLARGMQAALPYVDVFAPAHDVASLAALGRHLTL